MSARRPTPARIAPRPTRGGGGNGLRIVVTIVVIGLVVFFAWRAPNDPPPPSLAQGGGEPFDAGPVEVPICRAQGGKPFVVGEAAAAVPGEEGAEPERFAPFSVELGRGTRVDDGFVVGIKRDLETDAGRGTFAEVVLLDAEAQNGRLMRLGRIRGDLDAPLVVPSASGWVAAFVEPLPRSLALKLVRPDGDGLHWGAEIEQGQDESLAFDVAMGARVGVVTWDDLTDRGERGVVMLATVALESLEGGEKARSASRDGVDADLPRVQVRPGGFWLAYVARVPVDGEPPDVEGQFRAERIVPSWIELLPLDEDGTPQSEPRAVTPRDGHVLAYDLDVGRDGGAILAWRDDDTPSGAHGGKVTAMLVTASGAGQMQPVTEDDVGAGVPTLLGGLLAMPDGRGHVLAAPISPDAELLGPLIREDAFGIGQILASRGDAYLVARPLGKAAEFALVRCAQAPP
jgi:hypothetical protein